MLGLQQFVVFFAAALTLLLIPGPAVLYIAARSAEQGARAGIVSALGIAAGGVLHVSLAAVGLTAILAASAFAFQTVKLVGAGYLICLGIAKLSEPVAAPDEATSGPAPRDLHAVFWQGVVVQIFNPKIALFFLSFLPQFVSPARGNASSQILTLGLSFILLGFLTDSAYALAASQVSGVVKRSRFLARRGKWLSGLTYISLGTLAAVGRRK